VGGRSFRGEEFPRKTLYLIAGYLDLPRFGLFAFGKHDGQNAVTIMRFDFFGIDRERKRY
jgi:hypothetical protein